MTTFEIVVPFLALAVAAIGTLYVRHSAHQLERETVKRPAKK